MKTSRLCPSVLLLLWSTVHAQNNAANNVSDANIRVGWQAGSSERGTLSLVYSCLITIFTCTWTVLHLNVPGIDEGPVRVTLRKAKWMVITIMFPEYIFSKAIHDLRVAVGDLYDFKKQLEIGGSDCLQWAVVQDCIESSSLSRDTGINHTVIHTWKWEVSFGRVEMLLCRILMVDRPKLCARGAAGTQIDAEYSCHKEKHSSPDKMRRKDCTRDEQTDSLKPSSANALTQDRSILRIKLDETIPTQGLLSTTDDLDRQLSHSSSGIKSQSTVVRQQARVDGGGLEPRSSYDSAKSTRLYHTTQLWTLTHTYLANMGGIIYSDAFDTEKPDYLTLEARELGPDWEWESNGCPHPLKGLVLSQKDIEDKSKADWLLKTLTVLQISGLVMMVLVRSIKRLPISQLEIATLSFAVFAIATYAANWWKPKDISSPIILQPFSQGRNKLQTDEVRYFSLCYSNSHWAQKMFGGCNDRIPNDMVRMDSKFPAIFRLMALSSLVFGGLHSLAWKFDFPSNAERVLWRVAAVISASLPAFQVTVSILLWNISESLESRPSARRLMLSKILEELGPLDDIDPEYRQLLTKPVFTSWTEEQQIALFYTRDFARRPSDELCKRLKKDKLDWTDLQIRRCQFSDCVKAMRRLFEGREAFRRGEMSEHDYLDITYSCWPLMDHLAWGRGPLITFWESYEDQIRTNLTAHGIPLPDFRIPNFLTDPLTWIREDNARRNPSESTLARCMSYIGGIIYAASRLITIVLLFTSLRAAPKGIYTITPWTEFLPSFA